MRRHLPQDSGCELPCVTSVDKYQDYDKFHRKKVNMMKAKILLAIDSSESSLNAVRYITRLLGGNPDVTITLIHVLCPTPPYFLESGALEMKAVLDREKEAWEKAEIKLECKCFEPVVTMLKEGGFLDDQIISKHVTPDPGYDVAREILTECESGNYDTIVMGKRGRSRIETFLTGSVTEKVFRHAKGCAVWVIG